MYSLNAAGDRLVNDNQHETSRWVPTELLEIWNPWTFKWEVLQQVVYYGKQYRINSITTFNLNYIKVRRCKIQSESQSKDSTIT